jgi:toxin YoeB
LSFTFTEQAAKDLAYWRENNPAMVTRIKTILESIQNSPFSGIGKPEPLKHDLSGCWSRRINREHRLVYRVERGEILVLQCRFHY